MYLRPFEYLRPDTVADAVEALAARGDDASVYMGGTELLLLMKLGLAAPECLVDCKRIDGLSDISIAGGRLSIGAAVTHRQVEDSPLIERHLPILTRLVAGIGNVRVRSAGTLGGNLCFADPHSDPATLLIALGASVHVAYQGGNREVACESFVSGPYETALVDGDLLVSIDIPIPEAAASVEYERIGFRERPILNVAITRTGSTFRVVVAGGGRSCRRLPAVEQRLMEACAPSGEIEYKSQSGSAVLDEAAEIAAESLDPSADLDGSAAYKRQLMRVAFGRAVRRVLV
jgi:carbon-monoxide dehydrogenase medium subunit